MYRHVWCLVYNCVKLVRVQSTHNCVERVRVMGNDRLHNSQTDTSQ